MDKKEKTGLDWKGQVLHEYRTGRNRFLLTTRVVLRNSPCPAQRAGPRKALNDIDFSVSTGCNWKNSLVLGFLIKTLVLCLCQSQRPLYSSSMSIAQLKITTRQKAPRRQSSLLVSRETHNPFRTLLFLAHKSLLWREPSGNVSSCPQGLHCWGTPFRVSLYTHCCRGQGMA